MKPTNTLLMVATFAAAWSLACSPARQQQADHAPLAAAADAEAHLFTMAMILSGEGSVTIRRTENGIVKSYSKMPQPDLQARVDPWVRFLKREADADESGFVDLREGWKIRRRVELGLTAQALPDIAVDEFLHLGYQEREELLEDAAAYRTLRARAEGEELKGLPSLPSAMRGAVEQGDGRVGGRRGTP